VYNALLYRFSLKKWWFITDLCCMINVYFKAIVLYTIMRW
jgi:hypothetical protein